MKILHIITGLGNGGAEGMLYRVSKEHQKNYKNLDIDIVSLSTNDWYSTHLNKIGIRVHKIDLKKNFLDIFKLIKLIRLLIKLKPDVIQTWMYHANLLGGVLGYLFTNAKIFWNIRHTNLNLGYSKISTILIVHLSSLLSFFIPSKIIYCSPKSKKVHESKFYNKRKSIFIPNGYDDTFQPSIKHRKNFRKKNYISSNIFVVGLAARFHKEKNFKNLTTAYEYFAKKNNNVLLYLKGKNVSYKNSILRSHLLGIPRDKYKLDKNSTNIIEFMNGIDLFVLPSFSESFPNVLAEAMLCRTQCISTDVGYAKNILSNTGGIVVPQNNSYALFIAIQKSYKIFKNKKKWNIVQKKSREKVINHYNIKKISLRYFEVWKI